ncbi:MAG TPA: dihydrolipoamide acetyltransferase family protein [Tenuifilaceae bacterium]|nr:dihydrolipoamide acetyltransferase family protein [Tenuifilaceae bacterium]HPE17396.1 dihydrolipoamide acetyltransferase family protein [Tenuifilaceae bacterium]HPQ34552.1 dihydrolipoamide acetyltransferase family protein [Tenuifilaceae bacterium]HRX66871.1 dihydrolipoamide acetyltransferase family protein [Tenuifilaceae bacterium]
MFEIKMPKMGESIEQATITNWFVKTGDKIEEDDVLLEIATDKVDSEIPSPVEGVVDKILFRVNDLVPVGEVIAIINTGTNGSANTENGNSITTKSEELINQPTNQFNTEQSPSASNLPISNSNRFYSPLVKSIAREENLSQQELDSIPGTGKEGRVRKDDLIKYIEQKKSQPQPLTQPNITRPEPVEGQVSNKSKIHSSVSATDEIIQMDRMRKLIADHMVMSKQVSPHVTNMVEADVTNLVKWRERMKDIYQSKYKVKLTYMPVFTEAAARALRDFPMVNSSVDGDKIIVKGNVNIGIAVAKPDGNLIVPVVRDADKFNIAGLANSISNLAEAARNGKLSPDDIQGGTFSITNFGTFRNVMGTPIISQPQVAILATGTIEKKPAVVETEFGDIIVPRHKMFLSLSYDHRIVDGALGGAFLRRVADYLEQFDGNREV